MQCPQCAVELDASARHQCPQCRGMFVGDDHLNEMLAHAPGERRTTADWVVGSDRSERSCPVCGNAMFRMEMEHVLVERCPSHGVWFDRDELHRVLAPNVELDAAHEHHPTASAFELGKLGTVVEVVYSQIRRGKPQ